MFYLSDITEKPVLTEEESTHCVRVLRMQEGASLDITDGKGFLYHAKILEAHPKHCKVEVLSKEYLPRNTPKGRVEIAVAPTKNMDRMEWFVEKATEIGIDTISFLGCSHSERKIIHLERLRKVAISAMKQSLKCTLPHLNEMKDFKEFITSCTSPLKAIAYCSLEEERIPLKGFTREGDITILIGPEGDFSPEEVRIAKENGFVCVSLGESRLRTETAALVACHTIELLRSNA